MPIVIPVELMIKFYIIEIVPSTFFFVCTRVISLEKTLTWIETSFYLKKY